MLFLMALLSATPALAQEAVVNAELPDINVQLFRPTLDGKRTLWTDDSKVGADRQPFFRALIHYTDAPLVYQFSPDEEDNTQVELVSSVLQTNLMAGYAYGKLRVGVDLPIYMLATSQVGEDGGGLGDLALDGKFTLLGEDAALGAALQGRLTLPTGSVVLPLSNPTTGWEVAAVVDKDIDDLLLAVNVGIHGGTADELENISVNDSLVVRAAAAYAFSEDQGAAAEFTGGYYLGGGEDAGSAGLPIEALLSGYSYTAKDLVVRAGAGLGLTDGIGSPTFRAMAGIGWEPRGKRIRDTDMDGIMDDADQCIDEPEDLDGDRDEDGCPEEDMVKDSDGDGIMDADDKCPTEAEDKDTWKDDDGCPDPKTNLTINVTDEEGKPIDMARVNIVKVFTKTRVGSSIKKNVSPGKFELSVKAGTFEPYLQPIIVKEGAPQVVDVKLKPVENAKIVITRDSIELKEKVYFATGKAAIKAASHDMLNQVAAVMVDYPEIKKLSVEGHTDKRGNDSFNLKLSKDRAAAVVSYLEGKGVAAERLVSDGFGETKPIDTAENEEAYAKNRRVDITIKEWDAGEEAAE